MGAWSREPFPFSVRFQSNAAAGSAFDHRFVLAKSKDGAPIWTETVPTAQDLAETDVLYTDLAGGMGVRDDVNIPETRHSYYKIGASSAGGGVDLSYGRWIKSGALTNTTVDSGKKVYSIAEFNGKAYAAINTKVYESANKLFTDASSVYTASGNVKRLIAAQLQNSVPLLWAAIENGPYATYDGTTWAVDDASYTRPASNPQAFYKSTDAEVSFVDYTAAVTDGNNSTAADLSSLDTLANGDAFYVGFQQPFSKLTLDMDSLNGTGSRTLVAHYWTGTAWASLSISDGTASGGTTLAQDGTIAWTRPSATWARAVLTASVQARAYYYIRFTISGGTLDNSTTIRGATIQFQEEAADWGLQGATLWAGYNDGASIKSTTTGGRKATWNKTTNDLGPGAGAITGMAAVQGSLFVKRTTDLSSPDSSGRIIPYNSELYRPAATVGEGGMIAFEDKLWYSQDYATYAFSPTSPPQEVGPARLSLTDDSAAAVRMTCFVADRSHGVYGFGYSDSGGTAGLYKFFAYRQSITDSGSLDWIRTNALHQTHVLGSRKITAASVHYSGDQPYLVFGDTAGVVTTMKLPRGTSPLEANSGCTFNTIDSQVYLPSQHGADPARSLTANAWSVDAEDLSATSTVALATKEPLGASFTSQGTATAEGITRTSFTTSFNGAGLDTRVTLANSSSSTTPIVKSLTLHAMQPMKATQRIYELSVTVSDRVTADGNPIEKSADDWLDALSEVATAKLPLALTKPNGRIDYVLPRGYSERYQVTPERDLPNQVVSLVLASAT